MAQSTELRDEAFPRTPPQERAWERIWGKLRLFVLRTIFWSYERGSWQYDLIVLAILAFIFLAPRSWFGDRPTLQMTDLRHQQGIVELAHGKEGWHYLVDARLVESLGPLKPEEAIQEILRRRLNKPFKLKAWDKVFDRDKKVILGYTVVVEQ